MPYTPDQLSDRQDIVDVISRYCRAIDDNRPHDVAALFTEDCVLDYGGDYTHLVGRSLAERFFAGGTDKLYARSAHFVSNIEITFTGPDTATGITYVNAWHEFHDDKPNAWVYGRYLDELVRHDGAWRFARRTVRTLGTDAWIGEVTYIERGVLT